MKSNRERELYKIPSDISDRFYLQYDLISDVKEKLAESLRKRIEEIIKTPSLSLDEIRHV